MLGNTKVLIVQFCIVSSFSQIGCESEDPCGNGVLEVEAGESCDGEDIGTRACGDYPSLGVFVGGTPSCSQECLLDLGTCDSCWGYPCAPYGASPSDTITEHQFQAGNEHASQIATDGILKLSDLYKLSEAHEGQYKALFIYTTTAWCPYCPLESSVLNDIQAQYKDRGLLVVGLVQQDANMRPATAADAADYAALYQWEFPSVAPPTGSYTGLSYEYWGEDNPGAVPFNLLIDLNRMKIHGAQTGVMQSPQQFSAFIEPLLAD